MLVLADFTKNILKQICEFKAKLGSLIILEFKAAEALNS